MSNPSSHPHREPQPVNPYAASREAEPQGLAVTEAEPQRQYHIRLSWSDRKRFLHTVGPTRIYAVVGGVIGVWALFGLLQASYELWRLTEIQGFDQFVFLIRLALSIARGLVTLYLCWIYWKFADVIGVVAGGQSASMEEWSFWQLRLTYVLLATIAINLASQGWEWILGQYLLELFAPTP